VYAWKMEGRQKGFGLCRMWWEFGKNLRRQRLLQKFAMAVCVAVELQFVRMDAQ